MTKQLKISTRDYTSGRSGGARKESQKMTRRRNLGTVLIMYLRKKINSPTVRKVSHFYVFIADLNKQHRFFFYILFLFGK